MGFGGGFWRTMIFVLVVALAFGFAGGWLGWRMGTQALDRRSFDALEPVIPSGDRARREYRRRHWRRIGLTILFAIVGVGVGIAFLIFVQQRAR